MSNRFIKFIPSEEALFLTTQKPNAFRLLTIIASQARRHSGHPDGLEPGQCRLGDWKSYGMSQQEYRTAKAILVMRKHIEIIETCRTRKKSTTGATTKGTLVQLISLNVYDINPEESNDLSNDRATTEQRPSNDEQERIRKNKNVKKKNINTYPDKCDEVMNNCPMSTSSHGAAIFFDFENGIFQGIADGDKTTWAELYPFLDLELEISRAAEWVKSNPSKGRKKKLWRKFLTGWLSRANESAENKSAFKKAREPSLPHLQKNRKLVDFLCSRYENYVLGWRCRRYHDEKKDRSGILFEAESPYVQAVFFSGDDPELSTRVKQFLKEKKIVK